MKRKKVKDRSNSGFTLVELSVVIALVGILSAISLPVFLKNLPEKRLKSSARDLYGTMQKARTLAVKDNRNISIRFKPDSYYIDSNNNNTVDQGEFTVAMKNYPDVAYGKGGAAANSCYWNSNDSCTTAAAITFTRTGALDPLMVPPANIYFETRNSAVSYAVTANIYGSMKIRRFDGSSWE